MKLEFAHYALIASGGCVLFMGISLREHSKKMQEQNSAELIASSTAIELRARQRHASVTVSLQDAIFLRLRRILWGWGRTNRRTVKLNYLKQLRSALDDYRPHIIKILGQPEDALALAAIQVSGELGLHKAAAALAILAYQNDETLAAAAITVADEFARWAIKDIERFLRHDGLLVKIAALTLLPARRTTHLGLVLPYLGHPDRKVRAAAVRAVPKLMSGKELDLLCAFSEKAEGKLAVTAARALGQTGVPEQAALTLNELLAHKDWRVRSAAMTALAKKTAPLKHLGALLRILANNELSTRERALGFIALEKTGTHPVAELHAMLPGLPPILKMFAARCLISAGEASALRILVDLIGATRNVDISEEAAIRVVSDAQAILVEVTGKNFGKDKARWSACLAQLGSIDPIELKTELNNFW